MKCRPGLSVLYFVVVWLGGGLFLELPGHSGDYNLQATR